MAKRRHRNLFRESLETHARKRAESGLAPYTHAQWAEHLNDRRPKIGGQRVKSVGASTISRAVSSTPGVARRHGVDRAWILKLLGIDYLEYLAAWGAGPEGDAATIAKRRGRAER